MIKNVISSAARLPLASAKLTGRISGSLLRQLRGNGASEAQRESSARANRSSRSRTKAQPKRAKAQPKRAATHTRAKAQPKRAKAQPKRAKAQPKRAPRPKPLDDAKIAQKVESTVFRDVDVGKSEVTVSVDKGVVSLGGEVPTPDLIKELEARATRVTEVRRVENQLRLPKTPASGPTDTPAPQTRTSRFQRHRPEDRAVVAAESGEEAGTPAAAPSKDLASAGQGGAASLAESGAAESEAGRPDGEELEAGRPDGSESAEQDGPDVAELGQDPAYQPSDPSLRGLKGG
jgi:hypothetical protein